MSDLDAIIIGGGHNGLTCAAYLGMAGLRVRVLERRDVVGGACVTEEFHPGFRNSTAAYTVSLLQPKVIRDLETARAWLAHRRAPRAEFPAAAGWPLSAHRRGPHRARDREIQRQGCRALCRLSGRDRPRRRCAAQPRARGAAQSRARAISPARCASSASSPRSARGFGRTTASRRRFGCCANRPATCSTTGSSPIRSRRCSASMRSSAIWRALTRAGSAYVLLHHVFGEVNGKHGRVGPRHRRHGRDHAGDGARRRRARRAHRCRHARCAKFIIERDRAAGVVLEDGTAGTRARRHRQCQSAKLFQTLVPRDAVPARDGGAHEGVEGRLRHVPHERRAVEAAGIFRAARRRRSSHGRHHPGAEPGLHGPGLSRLRAAHGWSRKPIVEMVIPSTLDDSLAPPGAHVASLFCQHVAPEFADGSSWDAAPRNGRRPDDRHGRGLRAGLQGERHRAAKPLAARSASACSACPTATSSTARMTLDQLFSARPMLGYADYRMPIPGLYLCGSGAHPGGGVTGAPGHNAAQAVIADLVAQVQAACLQFRRKRMTSGRICGYSQNMSARIFRIGRALTGTGPVRHKADQTRGLYRNLPRPPHHHRGSRPARGARRALYVQLNKRWTIDGSPRWNVARYINHSCKPNARPVGRNGGIVIVADRRIEPGEEITYSYGEEYLQYFVENGGCHCAACIRKRMLRRRRARKRRQGAPSERLRHTRAHRLSRRLKLNDGSKDCEWLGGQTVVPSEHAPCRQRSMPWPKPAP